jgi:U3 small nucleolar RNA-associated protein 12
VLQVRLWDIASRSCQVTLTGHSGAVTCLGFSANGALLASGSADTSVIVWDVVGEAGLVRFKGHKDAVTDLVRRRHLLLCVFKSTWMPP